MRLPAQHQACQEDNDDRADQGRDDRVQPSVAEVEVPTGGAENEGAHEGTNNAGDEVAEQATGTANEHAGQPTGNDADHGHNNELLGVHVHVQSLPSWPSARLSLLTRARQTILWAPSLTDSQPGVDPVLRNREMGAQARER